MQIRKEQDDPIAEFINNLKYSNFELFKSLT